MKYVSGAKKLKLQMINDVLKLKVIGAQGTVTV